MTYTPPPRQPSPPPQPNPRRPVPPAPKKISTPVFDSFSEYICGQALGIVILPTAILIFAGLIAYCGVLQGVRTTANRR